MDTGKISLVPSFEGAKRDPAWLKFLGKNGLAAFFLAGPGLDAFLKEEVETIDTLLKAIGLVK